MKKSLKVIILLTIICLWIVPYDAFADDWYVQQEGYFTMVDDVGNELALMAREIFINDEYISSDNKHYKIVEVDGDKRRATAKYLGDIQLPSIEEEDTTESTFAQRKEQGTILLYCTHSDESYVPSDGSSSIKAKGGVYDVASSLKSALQEKKVNAVLDRTPHDPHDAGAYRRSQRTAIDLIKKNMPVAAVFDIHRDAVPAEVYATQVDGQAMTKVRMVIGGRNQNRKVNEALAYRIKAIADKTYPGLIKDIFIGQGGYNQELSPRSLLFEFGTYQNNKEEVKKSAIYFADVIAKAMYGGTLLPKSQSGKKEAPFNISPISKKGAQGSGRGILWIVGIVVLGGIIFLLISSGGRELFSKASKFTRDEFSSFLGRKKKK